MIAAVGFARSNGLTIAVRGGGHSVAGFSTCDGGIVIDLSPMNGVRVDPVARRADVGGGAVWADVDHETQAHGLATTGGLVSTTGVAGFTLGGGIGWTMRKFGLACDNLAAADVVTADGRLVRASETENADLLWGLRGGGGNFGIVTQFEFDLHPLGPVIYAGPIFYPAEDAFDLLRVFRDWAADAPDEITAVVNLTTRATAAGDSGGVARQEGRGVYRRLHRPGRGGRGARRTGPRALRSRSPTCSGPMPYHALQTLLDPLWPKGIHAYFKATNLARLDDELIDRLCKVHQAAPGPQCEIHVHQMGGAVGRVADGATAFPERSMPFVLNAVTGWHDAGRRVRRTREWARHGDRRRPPTPRPAARTSTSSATRDAARSAYGEETYARLASLKQVYDPTNVFRLNQNIKPAAPGS